MKKAQEASAYMIYDPSNPSNHRLLMEKMRAWKQLPKKTKHAKVHENRSDFIFLSTFHFSFNFDLINTLYFEHNNFNLYSLRTTRF